LREEKSRLKKEEAGKEKEIEPNADAPTIWLKLK
jgi:hypothetical protein